MTTTMIRADQVKPGDTLVPLENYGKVATVTSYGQQTKLTFDDGEIVICPPNRGFDRLDTPPAATLTDAQILARVLAQVSGIDVMRALDDAGLKVLGVDAPELSAAIDRNLGV